MRLLLPKARNFPVAATEIKPKKEVTPRTSGAYVHRSLKRNYVFNLNLQNCNAVCLKPFCLFIYLDTLDMLDVVSRMQLARHLDESGNWEKVARKFRQQRLVDLGPSLGSPTCSLIDILAVKIRQFIVTQWSYYASQLLSLYILVG